MKENNEDIKICLDKQYLLIFNKESGEFLLKDNYNKENFTLNKNTKLTLENVEIVCFFYSLLDLHLRLNFRDIKDDQKEVIFKFFEKANEYLLNKAAGPEFKNYLGWRTFFYKIDNRDDCLEAKNYKGEKKYELHFNKHPKWLSLCGGLNFDYDYYCADISSYVKRKTYYKINEETNTITEVKTRDKNGWIVKDGWIDKVGNFCSKNLCCCCCDCYNDEANMDLNQDIINNHENIW